MGRKPSYGGRVPARGRQARGKFELARLARGSGQAGSSGPAWNGEAKSTIVSVEVHCTRPESPGEMSRPMPPATIAGPKVSSGGRALALLRGAAGLLASKDCTLDALTVGRSRMGGSHGH